MANRLGFILLVALIFMSKSAAFLSASRSSRSHQQLYLLESMYRPDYIQRLQELYALKNSNTNNDNQIINNKTNRLTPGQKLMQQYSIKTPTPYDSIRKPAPKGDDRIEMSWFDSFKSSFWSTVDKISPPEPDIELDTNAKNRPLGSFTPVVRPKNSSIRDSVPDLQSSNPFLRLKAELQVQQMEFQEKQRQDALARAEKLQQIKEGIYKVGDAIKYTVDETAALPGKIASSAQKTADAVQAIPSKVQSAVETVQAIPSKVQQKANEVKDNVDRTIATTQKVVADIQKIPETVQTKAEETKQSYERFQESINQAATTGKVFLGLEKPIPKPPKQPPPPPASPAEIGLQIAGSVVSTTAKAAWWVGKSTAELTIKGAQAALSSTDKNGASKTTTDTDTSSTAVAYSSAGENKKTESTTATKTPKSTFFASNNSKPKTKEATSNQFKPKPPSKPAPPKKPASSFSLKSKAENNLDKEVADALKFADDALNGMDASPFKTKK